MELGDLMEVHTQCRCCEERGMLGSDTLALPLVGTVLEQARSQLCFSVFKARTIIVHGVLPSEVQKVPAAARVL